jgi:hypothetical protein
VPRLWALAGVGGDPLTAHGPDLAAGTVPAFTVTGPSGSGRSIALTVLARSLLAGGNRPFLVALRPSPLRELAGRQSVLDCFVQDDLERKRTGQSPSGPPSRAPEIHIQQTDRQLLGGLSRHRIAYLRPWIAAPRRRRSPGGDRTPVAVSRREATTIGLPETTAWNAMTH